MWRPVLPIVQTWYQQNHREKKRWGLWSNRFTPWKKWLKLSALRSYVSGLEMIEKKQGVTLKKCLRRIHLRIDVILLFSPCISVHINVIYQVLLHRYNIRLSSIDTYFPTHIGIHWHESIYPKNPKSDKQQVKSLKRSLKCGFIPSYNMCTTRIS